jgi:hypothetical protein
MRWWRRKGVWVGKLRALAWQVLLLGGALAFAGCATSSANEVFASAAPMNVELAHRESDGNSASVRQTLDQSNEPSWASSASGVRGPISALFSGLLGSPAQVSRADAEEALIVRAIAEHEMRNP